MTHIYLGNMIINFSDNGLSPSRRQAIIWTSAGILLFEHLETNFRGIDFIRENAFGNVAWKMATILFRPQCVKGMIKLSYNYFV